MEKLKIKVDILPSIFRKEDGTFDRDAALISAGHYAGVCYDREGLNHKLKEDLSKTLSRIDTTINNGHHSVYDHISISFNLQKIPKILAMVLNNEHQYTTSEKSGRYTPVEKIEGSIITETEQNLYNKWLEIFKIKIKEKYGNYYNDKKIKTLAQENARYLITVFMPTEMIYTTTLRQINYLASWMNEYIEKADQDIPFEKKLASSMKDFIEELDKLNVLDERLMRNEKSRSLSLFGKDLDKEPDYFGKTYTTTYEGSLAQYAQAQRHRTLDYQLEFLKEKTYYVPVIIRDDPVLVAEWLNDMHSVKDVTPNGEIVRIQEIGKYEDFILKCKERLCTAAQLEIMLQTRETLLKYKKALEEANHPLAKDIEKYSHGARCTFPDFVCTEDCHFSEGKRLIRKI